MGIDLSLVGLGLIILAWLVQIIFTLKGEKAMRPCFAGLQFSGIALLVVDTLIVSGQMTPLAWMNAISATLALMMLVLAIKK